MMIRNCIYSQLMKMSCLTIRDLLALLVGVTAALSLGTRIPRDFSSFAGGATDQPTGSVKNSAIITLSQKARRWQASLRVISDWMDPSTSVLSLTPIPGSRISISLWPAKAGYIRGVA